MALSLITLLNSNNIANNLRDSLLFILPVALIATLILNFYALATGTPVTSTYDGSVPYVYYELFLATFGARNIETD